MKVIIQFVQTAQRKGVEELVKQKVDDLVKNTTGLLGPMFFLKKKKILMERVKYAKYA